MATANRREVELALQITTANAGSITALQKDVAKLAKEGGDAAPEFQKLANELDRLSKEATALDGLDKIAADVERLARAQGDAAEKARDLTTRYRDLESATDTAATAQRAIEAALKSANREKQAAQDAIKKLNAEQRVGTREGYDYQQALMAQEKAMLDARAKIRDLKTGLEEARDATRGARQAQNELSNEYRNASTAAEAANRRLAETRERADEMARAMGGSTLATTNLVQAQNTLQRAFTQVKQDTLELTTAQERAAFSAKALADANEQTALRAQTDAAAYAQWWKNALAEQEAANAKVVAAMRTQIGAARETSDAIKNAFGTVGATSVEALENKITATNKAMLLLKNSGALTGPELKVAMKQGEDAVAGLERQIRAARGELTLSDRATNLWNQSMGGMKVGTLVAAGAISSLIQRVAEIGPAMVKAITSNESLVQSLNNIFKSSGTAASQISFLRQSANSAGVSVQGIQQSFVKFSAAMTGANVPLDQSNALFAQLTKASGSLGLSTDATNRAIEALGQIASKGTVSMEELRQQLGDALPGALGIAAKGLGLTEAEVIKLVSSGQLAASDFFPAFTEGLKTVSGEATTLAQNFERLKNGVGAFFVAIGDAGALRLMKAGLEGVSFAFKSVSLTVASFTESLTLVFSASEAFVQSLLGGGGLSAALTAASDSVAAAGGRIARLRDEYFGAKEAADANTVSATANANALGRMDASAAGASKALLQFNLAVADEAEKLAQAAQVAEINVKTAETLSATQIAATKNILDKNVAVEAEIAATGNLLGELQLLSDARTNELRLLQGQFEATTLLLSADGELSASDQQKLITLAQAIEKQDALVQGINAKVAATRDDLAQSELEKQMLKDNSGRVAELTTAYTNAKGALERLLVAKSQGIDVSKDLQAAINNERDAGRLLADSYSDSTQKLQAKGIVQKADNDLHIASLELVKANYVAMEKNAVAMGNEYKARQARIGQMETDIAITKAKVAYMEAEAKGIIAVANAKLEELKVSNQITPVKQAELEASIKMAEAKILEAKAIGTTVEALEKQLLALRNGTAGSNQLKVATDGVVGAMGGMTQATNGASDAVERLNMKYMQSSQYSERQIQLLEAEVAAQEKLNDVKERAVALENKRRGVDAEGFSVDPRTGNRITATGTGPEDMMQYITALGLDPNDPAAQMAAERLSKRVTDAYKSYSGIGFSGGSSKTIQQMAKEEASAGAIGRGRAPTTVSGTPAKTYNVSLGGRTVALNSDEDAQTLMGMLKTAKGST